MDALFLGPPAAANETCVATERENHDRSLRHGLEPFLYLSDYSQKQLMKFGCRY